MQKSIQEASNSTRPSEYEPAIFQDRFNSLYCDARRKFATRADFYRHSWRTNFDALSKRGQDVLIRVIETRVKLLEEVVEKAFWAVSRPLGWLNSAVDALDQQYEKSTTLRRCKVREIKLDETALERFEGEGGPVCEPESTPLTKAEAIILRKVS